MDGMNFPGMVAAARTRARHRALPPKPQWVFQEGINVVLFAGLGGACQGMEDAGYPVHVANNHDAVALAAHFAIHPNAHHVRGDIFDADPIEATGGRPVEQLWASPDCCDHSVAKGGAPRSPRVRSLAWQVHRWIGKTHPVVVYMENVREIRGWGPLIARRDKATGRVLKLDGSVAAKGERVPVRQQHLVRDKKRVGQTYRAFVKGFARLGYVFEAGDRCAADFGVATTRRRWYAVARRDGLPIVWPVPTHAPRKTARKLGLLPWVPAASFIDWSVPMRSIFGRPRPLAPATMNRIGHGMLRYVLDNPRPFIVPLTHTGGVRVHDSLEPLPTLTTAHRGEFTVVAPHMTELGAFLTGCGGRAAQVPPSSVMEPIGTMTTKGDRIVCAPALTHFNGQSVGSDVMDPLPTLVAGAPRIGVMAAAMSEMRGHSIGQTVDEPIGAQTTRMHHAVMAAAMIEVGYGEAAGQLPRTKDIEEPIGTQVAGGVKHAVVAAWMAQHNTGLVGHPMTEPVSTLTCGMAQQNLAAAFLTEARGTSLSHDIENPCPTLTAGGTHIGVTAAFLSQYYSQGTTSQAADVPLATLTTKGRFAIVCVDGVQHALLSIRSPQGEQRHLINDIRMRMLTPWEGAAAHELELPKMINLDGKARPLTTTEATRLIGNSVPKRMAMLLVRANAPRALAQRPRESVAA